jgi:actin-related protein
MGKEGVLALYSVGKVSGISLDMGHSSCTLTPVHDGYALMMGVRRNPIGGETMDMYFHRSLQRKKTKIYPSFMVEKDEVMKQRAQDRSELAAGNVGVQQRNMFNQQNKLPGGGKLKELPSIRDSFVDFHVRVSEM